MMLSRIEPRPAHSDFVTFERPRRNGASIGSGLTTEVQVPTIEQCRTYAAEYKILGRDQKISARQSAVLSSISRSWTALAHQLENLTAIVKGEGKQAA
jgi:hypothetical protein